MVKARIAVISLGGTISSVKREKNEIGVEPLLDAKALISSIPEISQIAEIEPVSFRMVPSPSLTFSDLFALRDKIEELFNKGIDGVVVTQGTDTLEETSFFLNCTVRSDKPVVVTGAMRNPTLVGSDGPANLLSAVRVAASKEAIGLGTLVVMNDEIHHSKYVTKMHTSKLDAFKSYPLGPIGWISEDRVRIALIPASKRIIIDVSSSSDEKKVGFFTVLLGDSGDLLNEIQKLNYDGLVVEGAGGGHVASWMVDSLASLAERIPVVLTSRTRYGEILTHTYSFPGSETELLKKGLIPGGALNSLKARILLYLLLRSGKSKNEIRKIFEEWL